MMHSVPQDVLPDGRAQYARCRQSGQAQRSQSGLEGDTSLARIDVHCTVGQRQCLLNFLTHNDALSAAGYAA